MTEIDVKIGLKGRYRIYKRRGDEITHDTGWFDNLITNQGMDYLSTGAQYLTACQVGSSSTTPQFTDVALGSRIGGVYGEFTVTSTIDTDNRYAVHRKTYIFPSGTATGNISEVGVGTSPTGNVLFSRALILDSFGVPTTITVLSDEDLVVIYELFVKQPTGDYTATVSGQSVTVRVCLINSVSTTAGWGMNSANGDPFAAPASGGIHFVYPGAIGAITGAPSGTGVTAGGGNISSDAYVPGSHTRVSTLGWLPAQANGTWLSCAWRFGPTYWQASFDPGLTKTNVESMRIKVRLTWSRDSGPA